MNIQALLKQAQKMQKDLEKAQKELEGREYESTLSGGTVKAVVTGDMELKSLEVTDDELFTVENKDMLLDMINSAVNDALTKAVFDKEQLMKKMTGGAKMPGMF